MQKFMSPVAAGLMGSVLTWVFLQPSFANHALGSLATAGMAPTCKASVGPARFTVGDRCFRDEVMVGRWDDNIYCANIEIICD